MNAYLRDATNGPFTAKDYRTWAATLGAAWLLCGQARPASEREKKRCVKQVIASVAQQLGHTASVCRASYIHPRVIDDFGEDRLAVLARTLARRVGAHPSEHRAPTIGVDILRAIEPVVAKYLHAAHAQRRRA